MHVATDLLGDLVGDVEASNRKQWIAVPSCANALAVVTSGSYAACLRVRMRTGGDDRGAFLERLVRKKHLELIETWP